MATVYLPEQKAYRPYGAALELFRYRGKEICLGGPAGTGKSRACLEKMHAAMSKWPKSRGLILRQTRASLTTTALVTFEQHVLPDQSPVKSGAGREVRRSYKYPNGSEIDVAGLEDVNRIMSSEYDLIYIQELIEISKDDYEMVTSRLRSTAMGATVAESYRQVMSDTNPGPPTHWIKERATENKESSEEKKLYLLPTKIDDNPLFYSKGDWTILGKEYLETLGDMTGFRRQRMLEGLWVQAEGARFGQLHKDIHRFSFHEVFPQGLPPGFKIILGGDWGTRDPYCCLWIAVDYKKNLWVFREDYKPGITTDLQPKHIIRNTKDNEIISAIYLDPAMWSHLPTHTKGSQAKSAADYYIDAFRADNEERKAQDRQPRFGPVLKGHSKDRTISEGVIDSALNRGNGYPDLYIEEGCVNLWKEISEAYWDNRGIVTAGKEIMHPNCKDHAITALYYAARAYYDSPNLPEQTVSVEQMLAAKQAKELEDARNRYMRSHMPNSRY